MHRLQELVRLHRLGRSARDMSRLLRMGRDTIRGYAEALALAGLLEGEPGALPEMEQLQAALAEHAPAAPVPPQQRSKVEAWRADIEAHWRRGARPTAIHDWLRLHAPSYAGSISAVKRMCQRLALRHGPVAQDVAIRVETAAGEVAQVDFAYAGLRYDPTQGVLRRSWLFVLTLACSRHMYVDLVFDQKVETWLRLHVRAFEEFGGVPRVLVPDNLKAAVVRAAFGVDGEAVLNRSYRELARHYAFAIDPAPPAAPEKKGKVERNVRYVRTSWLSTHESVDIESDRKSLWRWNREVAAERRHGTTGRVVREHFEAVERPALQALPATRFEPVLWKQAHVHRDVHVQVEGAFYSVPWTLLGKEVWVRVGQGQVAIYAADVLVATHARSQRGQRTTVDAHLPEHRGPWRHRSREHWIAKARGIGVEVERLVGDIFAADDVLHQLRKVQAVVRLLGDYPPERAERAARRARAYGCLDYRGIKNILAQALDLEPLPEEQLELGWIKGARYARRPELVPVPPEEAKKDGTEG
jgi:transposase